MYSKDDDYFLELELEYSLSKEKNSSFKNDREYEIEKYLDERDRAIDINSY